MRWLGRETTVTILEGPDAPGLHPRLFRAVLGLGPEQTITWGNRQATDEEIIAMTAAEQRLIYDFEIHKAWTGHSVRAVGYGVGSVSRR